MMTMLAMVVAVTATAAPPPTVAVLVARRTGVPAEELKRVAEATLAQLGERGLATVGFEDGLKRLKAAGISDTLACGGRPLCLVAAATRLGATHVVLLSGLQVEADRAWVLEALDVTTNASVLKHDWTDSAAAPSATATPDFARRLSDALRGPAPAPTPTPTPPVPVVQTPRPEEPTLVPTPTPAPSPVLTQPSPAPAPPPKVAPKVLLVVAGVLAAAAVGAAVAGAVTDGKLAEQQGGVSPLTLSEARRTRDTANALFGAAWVAGGLAAGAGTVALITW